MSTPYIGEVRMFGGNFAPVGWLLCQGQLLSIADYDVLFNLIGTTYGGDGQNTFALPDLQGRLPVHQGSGFTLGQEAGVESVTLTVNQIPGHSHPLVAGSQTADVASPAGATWGTVDRTAYTSATPGASMAPQTVGVSGGNQPHDNMSPYLVVNFIIATEGIYPSPS